MSPLLVHARFSAVYFTRIVFQRALAFIYFIAFSIAVNQYVPLYGENGILPLKHALERPAAAPEKRDELLMRAPIFGQYQVRDVSRLGGHFKEFWDAPSLLWWSHSDATMRMIAWGGLLLALFALSGFSERYGSWVSAGTWLAMWVLYQSLVNMGQAGQVFYNFGWETLLLETGFLAMFLGSRDTRPPEIVMWLILWIAFRIMFGAGLIKIRADECWRDLTCMVYHYESQPSPNPLSWYFHHTPVWFHKAEVLFNHFVELVVPFFLLTPAKIQRWAGGLTILFQSILILSGNLSWLNYITIVLCIPCFDDGLLKRFFRREPPELPPMSDARKILLAVLTAMIAVMSYQPVINLLLPTQRMNESYTPLHLVNSYGAFGHITRERFEIVIEGTDSERPDENATWKEYEFKGKIGTVTRRPSIASPYHYKLDWQMWFASFGRPEYSPWFYGLIGRLLQNEPTVTGLLAKNPFPYNPPKFIRARRYLYKYTEWGDRSGAWWKRELTEPDYFPPAALVK